jgi:acetate kinase
MAASAGGLDLLVFTGGIGENAAVVRADVAERLRHLGVTVDPTLNGAATSDGDVSGDGAAARTVVVRAGEDKQIVREVTALLA